MGGAAAAARRALARTLTLTLTLGLAGCDLTIDPKDGTLGCAADTLACPSGYYCAPDGKCWHAGVIPDLGASPSDLAVVRTGGDAAGSCGDLAAGGADLPAGCASQKKDGDETDVDCGGPCAPCALGRMCRDNPDCASGTCTNQRCVAPTCDDSVRNAAESDVDCGGGSCARCPIGRGCRSGDDCTSETCDRAKCDPFGVCVIHPCLDGKQDGDETDVDCGGACGARMLRCGPDRGCSVGEDCLSGVCTGKRCKGPQPDLAMPPDAASPAPDLGGPPDLLQRD